MPIGFTGQVGPQVLSDGVPALPRMGKTGDFIVSELHGRYFEGTYRKNRFGGAQQAVIATPTIAGLGTAVTGATVLYNPPSSSVVVSIEKFAVGFILTPAAPLVYGIATGFSGTALTGTLTSVTPKNKYQGAGGPVAGLVVSASVTLPVAATVDQVLGYLDTGAITTVTGVQSVYDIEGSIILPPGGYAHFWTSAVLLASAHIASWEWEEVPL